MKLNSLKIGARLAVGFGIVLVLLVIISAAAVFALEQAKSRSAQVETVETISTAIDDWRAGTQLNINRAVAVAKSGNDPAVADYFAPQIRETTAAINEVQAFLERSLQTETGRALFKKISDARTDYVAKRTEFFKVLESGDMVEAERRLESVVLPSAAAYLSAMDELGTFQDSRVQQFREDSIKATNQAEVFAISLAVISLLAGALFAVLITRSVTGPVQQAVGVARKIAEGDLTNRIDATGRDEMADLLRALRDMQASLQGIVATCATGPRTSRWPAPKWPAATTT